MRQLKKQKWILPGLMLMFCLSLFLTSCVSTKQLEAVQNQAQQALEKANMAMQ
jgi:hypothetical protein